MTNIQKALADVFGFKSFRPHQEEIVSAVMTGRDVFAVMPTGGGKSLCYQLPAAMKRGVTVVISPLISLMKDQVDAANANGIGAGSLNSSLTEIEKREMYSAVRAGIVKLLYISPERFNAPGFVEYLQTLDIAFFAVDEAHCISEWGHDFRPDYLSLAAMTREFPKIPVCAFTATATPRVADNIVDRLGLREPLLIRASFNRPNLLYRIKPKERVEKQILDYVRQHPDEAGIVYRTTRKSVESTVAVLRQGGVDARAYHAGLSDAERSDAQESFRHDRCQVIVATIAFGMGIDKPNVRYVVHGDLPKNIEGYYQETGRAGRDGEPAECLLFHAPGDMAQIIHFNSQIEDPVARQAAQDQLSSMATLARTDQCRRAALLAYFGEEYPDENCATCDICLGEVEREDATVSAQKALSAMVRTGGRFGALHIADILVGADTEKIRQTGHNSLPTYGVGKDHNKRYWRYVIESLVAKGMATVADARFPTPSVTEKGWKVLRGETSFEILKYVEKTTKETGTRSRGRSRTRPDDDIPYDTKLFALLRQKRNAIAAQKNLPPYVILWDRPLREMARLYPETEEEMLNVGGIGQHKLSQYGETFMELIREYLKDNPNVLKPKGALPPSPSSAAFRLSSAKSTGSGAPAQFVPDHEEPASRTATEAETCQLFEKGWTIEEAAKERNLRPETIVNHLEKLLASGAKFNPEQFMPRERLEMIRRLFLESGSTYLKPVVEASGETVSYLEARIVRLFLEDLNSRDDDVIQEVS